LSHYINDNHMNKLVVKSKKQVFRIFATARKEFIAPSVVINYFFEYIYY